MPVEYVIYVYPVAVQLMGEPGNGTLFGLLPQNLLYSIAYMHVVVEVGVEAIAPACFVAWLV